MRAGGRRGAAGRGGGLPGAPSARGRTSSSAWTSGARASARGVRGRPVAARAQASPGGEAAHPAPPQTLLLVECEGVLVDVHEELHRRAFNRALSMLGCPPVMTIGLYGDLLRLSDGTGQGLLHTYFGKAVGWPSHVEEDQREDFVEQVLDLKAKVGQELLGQGLKTREGVVEFLTEAASQPGVKVGLLAGTGGGGEEVVRSALRLMLPDLVEKLEVVKPGNPSSRPNLSMEAFLEEARMREKQELAQAAVQELGSDMTSLCAGLFVNNKDRKKLNPQTLLGLSEQYGVEAEKTLLICNNSYSVKTARTAGIGSVVVKSRLTQGAQIPKASAKFDGFGPGGGVTFRRLSAVLSPYFE